MEWNLSSNICRCCLSQGSFKGLNSPNFWMGEEELYSVMLRECFDVTLSQSDKMSDSGICEVCITQLRNSFNFKKQVLNSEALFQARLTEHSTKVETDTEIKVEILEDHGSDKESNSDFGAERLDDLQDMEQVDMEIKYESPPEKKRGGSKRSSATLASSAPVKKSKRIKKETSAKTVASKSLSNARLAQPNTRNFTCKWTTVKEKHLHNLRTILRYSNATPFQDKYSKYACVYCDTSGLNADELREHTKRHDAVRLSYMSNMVISLYAAKLDITNLKCALCLNEVDDLKKLKDHLVESHDQMFHFDIDDHILPFRLNNNPTFNCVLCENPYGSFCLLHQHMNSHFENYYCKLCNSGFVTSNRLRQHSKRHEMGSYKCDYCDKVFLTLEKKKNHEKGAHTGSWLRFNCPECPLKFSGPHSRDKHIVDAHGGIPQNYPCKACNKIFEQKLNLSKHVRRDHLLERKHKCAHCSKSFFLKKAYKMHQVVHTGERKFKCDLCQKCYSRKDGVRTHMKSHYSDRRVRCEICDKTFAQKCTLNGHVRSCHPDRYVLYSVG